MRSLSVLTAIVALSLGSGFCSAAHATGAKYFASVAAVVEADGVKSGIVGELKDWFIAELKSRPEFTLALPPGVDLEASDADLAKAFKQAGLRAFELSVRVLEVKQEELPPKPGKQFSTLVRGIRLSVFGQTIPGKVMAIGGDGAAEVAVEIGHADDVAKLSAELMQDTAKQSLKQAVDMTIQKLKLANLKPKLKAKAKK